MKRSIFLIIYLILFFFISFNLISSQDTDSVLIDTNPMSKEDSAELMKLQLPNIFQDIDFDFIFSGDKAIIKFFDQTTNINHFRSIAVVDLRKRKILNTQNFLYQFDEVNSPDYVLIAYMKKRGSSDTEISSTRLNIQLSLPPDENLRNYQINIAKVNLSSGNFETLVEDVMELYTIPHMSTELFVANSNIPKYFNYIRESNIFTFKKQGKIIIYNLNDNKMEQLGIRNFYPKYLGNIDNTGTTLLMDEQAGNIYIYDLYQRRMFKVSSNVTKFDVMDRYQSHYFYPMPYSQAFMYITRNYDTNGDGNIDKYDNSELCITYLDSKTKSVIYEGVIDEVKYYQESNYISYSVIKDSNGDNRINEKDHYRKLFVYDTIGKQRVYLSNNGFIGDYIEKANLFVYYTYEKDTNNDNQINRLDEPSSHIFSTIAKALAEISSGKVIDFEVVNADLIVFSSIENNRLSNFIYDIRTGNKTLLSRDMYVEKSLSKERKVVLRKGGNGNAELFLFDANTNSLISLGKNTKNLKEYKLTKNSNNNEDSYCYYIPQNKILVMVQQSEVIDNSGNEILGNFYNFVMYDVQKNVKNIPFQGDIYSISAIEDLGKVLLTVRPKGKLNFETNLIDTEGFNVKKIDIISEFAGEVVYKKKRYFILYAPDSNQSLYLFDIENNKVSLVSTDVTNFPYPEEDYVAKTVDGYVLFPVESENEDDNGSDLTNKKLNFVLPNKKLKEIGPFNNKYFYEENMKFFVLISNKLNNQIIDIRIYYAS